MNIAYTIFSDKTALRSQSFVGAWEELTGMLRAPDVRSSKADCQLIKLATFGTRRSAKGSFRHTPNLESVSGCEGDYDAGKMQLTEAAMLLSAAGVEAFLYSSANHTAQVPRWRVLLPFSQSYPKSERSRFLARANGVLGGVLGDESFSASQSFYFGRVAGVEYEVQQIRGTPIDLLDELDAGAIGKAKRNGTSRADRLEELHESDPVIRALRERGWIKNVRHDGGVDIICPFAHEHSMEGGAGDCCYWPPRTNGFSLGAFHCLHSHCADRPQDEYLTALGLRARPGAEGAGVDDDGGVDGDEVGGLDIEFRYFDTIERRPINWLWPSRLARGKVNLLVGAPGLGKSQVALSLAAIVSTGGTFPVDGARCAVGSVAVLSAEDAPDDTIGPRLDAAGADARRVINIDAVRDSGKPRLFNLSKDLERLGKLLRAVGDIALVVVDPVSAYMSGVDAHSNSEVRSLLASLASLAAEHNVAVVCISHLNKSAGTDAISRINGSGAFAAAVRSAFLVTKDPDDAERRLMCTVKNNLGRDDTGFAFSLVPCTVGSLTTSKVVWEPEFHRTSADDALADPDARDALADAKDFLSELLADGALSMKRIQAEADEAGHAWATVRRAKKALGIKAVKERGGRGGWTWSLPESDGN